MNYRNNRFISFIIIILIYVFAFAIGYLCFLKLPLTNLLLRLLVADVITTLIVWLFGVIFHNSSIYDPYWSILPMAMMPIVVQYYGDWNIQVLLMLMLVELWGLRLTSNWAYGFQNLNKEDWRYQHYRQAHPKWWFVINLFGINLMPTLVVFGVMLPAINYADVARTVNINIATIMSLMIALAGIVIAGVADAELHRFKKHNTDRKTVLKTGLWKNSRHPNYFGENVMWLGVFLMMLSINSQMWVMGFMPLIHFLLFALITAPMMDKHLLASKPDYRTYYQETNAFMILFKK